MSEGRCEKHDMILSGCADCNGVGAAFDASVKGVVATDLLIERFLIARYDGRCAVDRSHPIVPGDEIGFAVNEVPLTDGSWDKVGWVCEACVEEICDD
jgi:hypothetical protein